MPPTSHPTKQAHHITLQDCIRAMRTAMLRQRLASEQLGMDMSLHFLRVLEELSIDPDVGYRYMVRDSESGKPVEIPPQQVSGVFTSMLKKYREIATFSYHEQEVEITRHWARAAGKLAGHMTSIVDKYELDKADTKEARTLIAETQKPPSVHEATPPESPPPDPSGS